MTSAQSTYNIEINCDFCGHVNRMTIATVSLSPESPVACPGCGGHLGAVADFLDGSARHAAPEQQSTEATDAYR